MASCSWPQILLQGVFLYLKKKKQTRAAKNITSFFGSSGSDTFSSFSFITLIHCEVLMHLTMAASESLTKAALALAP